MVPPSGEITNTFTSTIQPNLTTGQQGASNLQQQVTQVTSGSAINGPGYNFTIDPGWLNYDQITNNYLDNTAKALMTQVMTDGIRPGNYNLAEGVFNSVLP